MVENRKQVILLRKINETCEFCGGKPSYHWLGKNNHFYYCESHKLNAIRKLKFIEKEKVKE